MINQKKIVTLKVEKYVPMKNFLLKIASLLYGMVISVRNMLFDKEILKGKKYDIPIVCIGNITAGGTGKTPTVEFVVSHFSKQYNVAVLSRGFGRDTRGYRVVDVDDNYRDVGDEPLQIKCKFPNIPVIVCEKRTVGIERLLDEFPDTDMIIMDDGFQHRWVKPYLNIVMIDSTRPVDKDDFMPIGQLRDSIDSLVRAHIFIFTKCPTTISQLDMRLLEASLNKKPSQATFFTRPAFLETRAVVGAVPVVLPMYSNVIAMSGIGNNEAFYSELKSRYNVVETFSFKDHHKYCAADAEIIAEALERHPDAFIITTEKDAIKLFSCDEIPVQLRSQMFYECVGMEFVSLPNSDAEKTEAALRERLDNEIDKFNDDAYIRGC